MPIIATPAQLIADDIDLAIWQITETASELRTMCLNEGIDTQAADAAHHDKRRIEILCELLLVKHLLHQPHEISHHPNGAAYIEGFTGNISISHSIRYVAIATSRNNIGIDVERYTPQVQRVRTKFLSSTEQEALNSDDLQGNTVAWTTKEALYKAIGVAGLDFANDEEIDAAAIARGESHHTASYRQRQFAATSHRGSDYALTIVRETTHNESNQI